MQFVELKRYEDIDELENWYITDTVCFTDVFFLNTILYIRIVHIKILARYVLVFDFGLNNPWYHGQPRPIIVHYFFRTLNTARYCKLNLTT